MSLPKTESLVVLTREPIEAVLAGLEPEWRTDATSPAGRIDSHAISGRCGAWLDFYGIVRDTEPDGSRIRAIDYEAHETMAEHQLGLCIARIESDYPLDAVLVIHRIGEVPVGEPSLLVRILSGHRGEALDACRDFINLLKADVPIWKQPVPAQ